jgi:glycerol-3-phosphate dehydrogenase (NAD(P)+)
MAKKVGVIGAGAWGTAIAKVLAENGHEVTMWSYEADVAASINERRENARWLPEVRLPEGLRATTDPVEAATGKDYLIMASPSLFLLDSLKSILSVPNIREGETHIGVLTKGFITGPQGPRLIVEALEDYLPGFYRGKVVYIAGPSHAEEVSRGKLTGLIAASPSPRASRLFRLLLSSRKLLVFSSLDVVGVQVCAAAKNVIAIAFGMLDALKADSQDYGDGTESFLLASGLNEMMTLGRAMGATHPETFTSISGVGDLDVTCRSEFGRNRRFGRDIILKRVLSGFKDIEDLVRRINSIGYLPEGAVACAHVEALARKHGLRMPISHGVYRILNREIEPEALIKDFVESIN